MPVQALKRKRPEQQTFDLKGLKQPWSDWCAARGVTPTEGVRKVLATAMENNPVRAGEGVAAVASVAEPGWRENRVQLRLTNAEHAAMSKKAESEGMTLSRWLISVGRMHAFNSPVISKDEVRALTVSSQQLAKLGRNINTIAHHMNERADKDELTLAQIELVRNQIQSHTAMVTAMLDANSNRWRT